MDFFTSGIMPYIHPTSFEQDQNYNYFVLGADLIFLGIVPMCVLLSSITLLYMGGVYSNIVVYVIVVIQIACHAPRNILNTCDIFYLPHNNNNNNNNDTFYPHWLLDISHLLLTISSSITVSLFTAQEHLARSKTRNDLETALSHCRLDSSETRHGDDREVTNKLMEETSQSQKTDGAPGEVKDTERS